MSPRVFKTAGALQAFFASRRGVVLHVSILHDEDTRCTPSRCTCRPWYRVSELTTDSWIEAEKAEKAWLAEGAN